MIKILPVSLDLNTPKPMGAFLFVKDLCSYSNDFEQAISFYDADCLLIPQFSQNVRAPELFDVEKAEVISNLKKPIIMHNDGGGIPDLWKKSAIGQYIWQDWAELIKVFFSVECYDWHRKELPSKTVYAPFDFVGYSDFGLGLREVPPLQSKEKFISRPFDTSVVMNVYPPTRDVLWDMVTNGCQWHSFHFRTHYAHEPHVERIGWREMADGMIASKITFAPDGATSKTERQLFVPAFAAMMMQEDSVEFPYEWIDGVNCLKMIHNFAVGYEREKETEYNINGHNLRVLNKELTTAKILNWLSRPDELYEIYCRGYETAKQYELPNYFKNYISQTIKNNI